MEIHESGENYLETILVLKSRQGQVRSVDIANELSFAKPSVSRAVGILRDKGCITICGDNSIELTPKGHEIASMIYERHMLLAELLMDIGVDAKTAYKDACRIEHVISPATFDKIKEYVKGSLRG